ncbi:MAG: AI-2E family transporter [Clostridia bacterium]|nr:AI-2E family transporter [Clostridia bacterium]
MEEKIKTYVTWGLFFVIVAVFALVAFKWLVPAMLPFALGALIAAGVRTASDFLSKKLHTSKKLLCVVLIVFLTFSLLLLFWFAGRALLREALEAARLCAEALSDENGPVRALSGRVMEAFEGTGLEKELAGFDMGEISKAGAVELTKAAAALAGSLASGAPSFFLFFAVLILSVFYFSCDISGITAFFDRFISERSKGRIDKGARLAVRAFKRFAKAYLLLFAVTLLELTVGFMILRVKYPLLTALLTALVDLLPVFGVGTVLVPWSIFLFITGQTAKGIGFLVFFAAVYCVRQFLEPRLVGDAAGVHPVAVLFSIYLGFSLFGVGGLLAAPLLLNGFCVFLEEKRKKLRTKVDKEERRSYNYME